MSQQIITTDVNAYRNTGDSQMGKREAYNRFLGKDYPKSTFSSSSATLDTRDASRDNEDAAAAATPLPASWTVDKAQRTLDVCNEEVSRPREVSRFIYIHFLLLVLLN